MQGTAAARHMSEPALAAPACSGEWAHGAAAGGGAGRAALAAHRPDQHL